ncbi:MAG TPA: UDP-N-acetylglucosamine 1-carboxyvinyltransferase [Thermoflexales bacterium]|nr:UDP-N-acetylglucosamine 1-carboxyvinyltransferase [Thermoflexales bacterium]
MSKFIIQGGVALQGEVTPAGNKNAALPMLAATLLTDKPVILHNVPYISDVRNLIRLIGTLGASAEWIDERTVRIEAATINSCSLDPQICREIRASILLAGPMVSRCGDISLPPPGGDVIGRRRLDTHFLALRALGATVRVGQQFDLKADKLRGADFMLDEASVTATENAIMAAVRAKGTTILRNAASEPHVQDLCNMLNAMGAKIENIGSNQLVIHGTDGEMLNGAEVNVGPDNIEVASFIALSAVCGQPGDGVWIRNAAPQHLGMTRLALGRLGIHFQAHGGDVFVPGAQSLRVVPEMDGGIPKIDDAPWPGFPADALSSVIVAATQCEGTVLIHEKMFESRLYFVDKLIGMGARIVLCDPHRALVQGVSRLRGDNVQSPDIRAGFALVIAALCADGQSVISNAQQIDRGYDHLEEKLRALGAKIERQE